MRDPFSLKIEPGTQDGSRVPPDPQKSSKIMKNDAERAEKTQINITIHCSKYLRFLRQRSSEKIGERSALFFRYGGCVRIWLSEPDFGRAEQFVEPEG